MQNYYFWPQSLCTQGLKPSGFIPIQFSIFIFQLKDLNTLFKSNKTFLHYVENLATSAVMNTHNSLAESLIIWRFSLKTQSFDFKYLPLIALGISYLLDTNSTLPLGCVPFGLFCPGCLVWDWPLKLQVKLCLPFFCYHSYKKGLRKDLSLCSFFI